MARDVARELKIQLDNVHPRTGVRVQVTEPADHPIGPAGHFPPRQFGALIHFKRSYKVWMDVQAEVDAGGTSPTRFSAEPDDLGAAVHRHQAAGTNLAARVMTEQWVNDNSFLVASLSAGQCPRLRFALDTNQEGFVKFATDRGGTEEMYVELTVVFFQVDGAREHIDRQTIKVVLSPGTPVEPDPWVLAVDVGNTSTTVALLDPVKRGTRDVVMLTARPVPGRGGAVGVAQAGAPPIPSDIRLDRIRTWLEPGQRAPLTRHFPSLDQFPDDDKLTAAEWVVGELARTPGAPARSLILGAKRMAADRAGGSVHVTAHQRVIPADDRLPPTDQKNCPIELDTRAPLELLACRVLHHCREARRRWPYKIALTYPTTFSRGELQALRRGVQAGWLRMQGRRQRPERDTPAGTQPVLDRICGTLQQVIRGPIDLATQARDPIILLPLDEASAAAFFYLYRKIFEEIQGGLVGFRYLYPAGLNMLLYDCGGGTTDIALVRAGVEADGRTLRIAVRGRSGVRTFGGDDITVQAARLVKAKVAALLAHGRGRPVPATPPPLPARPPTKPAEWEKLANDLEGFIKAVAAADPADDLVPTRDLPGQQPQEDRRAAALALWRWAEEIKHKLAEEPPAAPGQPAGVAEARLPKFDRDTNPLTRAILTGDARATAETKRRLETVTVSRTEIDALIYRPVMRSIENCNTLIRKVLDRPTGDDGGGVEETHWVVASGNAVQYPFLRQMMKRHLDVAFLEPEDGRFLFDRDMAKDATAKGAALALAVMEDPGQQIQIKFDSDLADHLPFDVGFRDMSVGRNRLLYKEHTHYRAMAAAEPLKIPLGEAVGDGPGRQFVLRRQFPGDPGFSDYLVFRFEGGIKGDHLTVRFDETSPYEFLVTDGEDTHGVPTDLTAGDVYRAPPQWGDI